MIREALPDVPIIAVTATATAQVREDIIASLGLRQPLRPFCSSNRENLSYVSRQLKGKDTEREIALLCKSIKSPDGSGCAIVVRATLWVGWMPALKKWK